MAIAEPFGPPTWTAALATALQAVMGAVGALQPRALALPAFPHIPSSLSPRPSGATEPQQHFPRTPRALVTMNTHTHMAP